MPNILLTSICNGRCPYCFASIYMNRSVPENKEISLQDFAFLLDSIRKNGNGDTLMLLGGEPTLHSRLGDIFRLIKNKGFRKISLFSNGIISPDKIGILKEYGNLISYVWNINPPEIYPPKLQEYIENTVLSLSGERSHLGFNIFGKNQNTGYIINIIGKIRQVKSIRIGITHPVGDRKFAVKQKFISVRDYPQLGSVIYRLILKIKKKYSHIKLISLDCGYAPCMFSPHQAAKLRNSNIRIKFSKCKSLTDIDTKLYVKPCFSTAVHDKYYKLSNSYDITKSRRLLLNQWVLSRKYLPLSDRICVKCSMNIYCFGGCLGERILQANKGISRLLKRNGQKIISISEKLQNEYRIICLLVGKKEYAEAEIRMKYLAGLLNKPNVQKDASCLLYKLDVLYRETRNSANPQAVQYLGSLSENDKKRYERIDDLKQKYIVNPSGNAVTSYSKQISRYISENKPGRSKIWIRHEIKQFIDFFSGSESSISHPDILIILYESILWYYGKKGALIMYPEFMRRYPRQLNNLLV